ncbi:MAG TPA: hypothetical protein VJZ71_12990 [Phycisphaerae bacterium]|nr:hypothetical protein [Phycisphaerae bacterium]
MAFSFSDVFKAFGYTLSLPERLVRSTAAAVGGVSKLLTDTIIPEPLRKTTAYTAMVGNMQRFLIEKVAEVQGAYEKGAEGDLPDKYIPRVIAGNVISAAGLFAMRLSPLWVFAFLSDAAHGSQIYLNRLVGELKESGVIPPNSDIKGIDELLTVLGKAGKDTAQVFDLPPVDVDSLKRLRDEISTGYTGVFKEATDLMPRMDTLWGKMQTLATRDGVAVESIVGLMTLDLGKTAGKAVDTAFAVGNVTADLLNETIFQSYGETIERIQRQGAVACLEEAGKPYVEAIASHWSVGKKTLTERAWDCVTGALTSKDSPAEEVTNSIPPADNSGKSATQD